MCNLYEIMHTRAEAARATGAMRYLHIDTLKQKTWNLQKARRYKNFTIEPRHRPQPVVCLGWPSRQTCRRVKAD